MRTCLLLVTLLHLSMTGLTHADEKLPTEFKSAEINAECKKLPELEAQLRVIANARLAAAREELLVKLRAYQIEATKSGDLEEALRVRDTISDLEAQQAVHNKTAPATAANQKIPSTAARYGKSRYQLMAAPVTLAEARKYCEEHGGYLAKIESEAEHKFCAKLMQQTKLLAATAQIRINGNDRTTQGTYVFDDGTPVTYFRWEDGEPNGRLSRRFLLISASTGLFVKGSEDSARRDPFICEWDIVPEKAK